MNFKQEWEDMGTARLGGTRKKYIQRFFVTITGFGVLIAAAVPAPAHAVYGEGAYGGNAYQYQPATPVTPGNTSSETKPATPPHSSESTTPTSPPDGSNPGATPTSPATPSPIKENTNAPIDAGATQPRDTMPIIYIVIFALLIIIGLWILIAALRRYRRQNN